MLKRAVSVMVAGFVLLAVGLAVAHGASKWRWWQNPEIIQQLNLTQDEIKQLDDAYLASRRRMIELKSRVEAERYELEELLGQSDFSEADLRAQNRKLEAVRSHLAEERFDFLLKTRNIIGHERFQLLTEIQRKWREERRNKRK